MPIFRDTADREWNLLIDPLLIEQVREQGDPLFLKGEPADTLARLDEDPALLCGVVWVLCKEQAAARGIDQKAFYFGVAGDGIDVATKALTDAIVSFIPRRHRELIVVGAAKNAKIREIQTRKGLETLNSPTLEAEVEAFIDSRLAALMMPLKSAGSMPASSESTPKD